MRKPDSIYVKNDGDETFKSKYDGEEIVITRHGRPVARLVPNSGTADRTEARAAAERIRARAATLGAGFDWEALKRDRDEGRP